MWICCDTLMGKTQQPGALNMAKATRTFYGTDSQGRHIEVAKSESGRYFYRQYGYNGYGKCWSKWMCCDDVTDSDIVKWESPVRGKYDRLEWGFSYLDDTTPSDLKTLRYRLPG